MTSINFHLESSKTLFRLAEMTEEEQRLWMDHLKRDGWEIDDPREIFEPFDGEDASFLNEDVGTQELRVRIWKWIDSQGHSHHILDINAWPGDNESGVITIDGVPVLTNSDQSLYWIGEPQTAFAPHLDFFSAIRRNLFQDREFDDEEELQEQFDQFFESEAGQNAVKIDNAGHTRWEKAVDDIHEEHRRLKEKYRREFIVGPVLPKVFQTRDKWGSLTDKVDPQAVAAIADQIGYELEENQADKMTRFIFVQWNGYQLVTVERDYKEKTFLLNIEGKIIRQIYKSGYLADGFDHSDELLAQLVPRIHAYREVMYQGLRSH